MVVLEMSFHLPITGIVSGALWEPTQINADVWLSASRSSYVGGTWGDLSGNGYDHVQATASRRPTYNATGLNGYPTLVFDGTDDYLDSPAGSSLDVARNVTYAWCFNVYQHATDVSATERPIVFYGTNSGGTRFALNAGSPGGGLQNRPYVAGRRLDADSPGATAAASATALTNGENALLLATANYSLRTLTLYKNGASHVSASGLWSGGGSTSNTASSYAAVGRSGGRLNGCVSESVVGNNSLSAGDIDKLFGWAAHYYGLTALLPGGHPYKTSPPKL